MSVLQNNPFLLASGSPTDPTFPIERSVRLRSSVSAYFNRALTTPTSQNIWTYSVWLKIAGTGTYTVLTAGASNYEHCYISAGQIYYIAASAGGTNNLTKISTSIYRDPSSWYHLVIQKNASANSGVGCVRIWVNNQEITAWSTNAYTGTQASVPNSLNVASTVTYISSSSNPFDGYLTQANFVDGQALIPTSFGGYNPGTGVWEPRQYTGTYGNNGFYLPFTNNASLEALGYDSSISSPELITNGMFVTNVTGWTNAPFGGGTPSITWQSNHTARIANPSNNGTVYYQAITTVIGETYYAQAYVAAASIGGAARTIALQKADNTSFSINNVTVASLAQSAAPGVMRGTFVATATTTYIFINVDILGTGTTGADVSQISVAAGGYKDSWNPFGISLTAGTAYDSMLDVPTNTSNTNANFPTLNRTVPQDSGYTTTTSAANLDVSITYVSGANMVTVPVTMQTGSSGKWYWEVTATSTQPSGGSTGVGISTMRSNPAAVNLPANSYIYVGSDGSKTSYTGTAVNAAYGASYTTNNVIGVALDIDAGTLTFYKNNTSQGVAFTGLAATNYFPIVSSNGTGTRSYSINCGQRPFSYTPPSGFKSLNTFNLPDPAITKPVSVHNLYTYTGNGGGQQIGEIQKPMSLFNLDRSLRFRSSASAYLSRTPASAGSRTTWTWSGWIKRGTLGVRQDFFGVDNSNKLTFSATDILSTENYNGAGADYYINSTDVYRDPNMWYHVVAIWDSNNATAGDKQRLYVNGIRITGTTGNTIPSGATSVINSATSTSLGRNTAGGFYFDGYLADVYFIDGQALTPDSFGQYDGNYYWTPKAYTGAYGTNGFHLEFEDFSASTAAAIGKDTSGLGNDWTPSAGINLTTPANTNTSWDSMTDVPTLTNADTANFCTANPLNSATTLTNANLTISATANTGVCGTIEIPSNAGSFYWETTATTVVAGGNTIVGMIATNQATTVRDGTVGGIRVVARSDGLIITDTTTVQSGLGAWSSGDVIGCAYNATTNSMQFYKNGSTFGTAVTLSSGYSWLPVCQSVVSGGPSVFNWNFGQRPFKYSNYGVDRPAATFKPINSFNIAEVTGDVETPDVVWIKSRNASSDHTLFNSISGVGKYTKPNVAATETTDVNSLIQFNKNGFLLGNSAAVNTLSTTYIAMALKMAATTVTNNGGTIPSQVRANFSAGISLVRYTGTGTGALASVGHGLLLPPEFIVVKNLSASTNWPVYHVGMGDPLYYMYLNNPAIRLSDNNFWGATLPDAAQFYILGTSGSYTNISGNNYEALCMRSIEGFSKFGTYISNNATDGPYVYTGFRPRWLMVKRAIALSGQTGGWFMYDAARNTYNVMDKYLFAESPSGENSLAVFDFTANGFKIRSNNVHVNTTSGDTYVYLAFAENPFKYALAR